MTYLSVLNCINSKYISHENIFISCVQISVRMYVVYDSSLQVINDLAAKRWLRGTPQQKKPKTLWNFLHHFKKSPKSINCNQKTI